MGVADKGSGPFGLTVISKTSFQNFRACTPLISQSQLKQKIQSGTAKVEQLKGILHTTK